MTSFLLADGARVSEQLSDILKVVQISFYAVGMILAVLTYRAAKGSWLTPTSTEYQKRVIDRLAKLSEDLYSEFDRDSDKYWPLQQPVEEVIREIDREFQQDREAVLAAGKWQFGIPHSRDADRLEKILHRVLSDPFIPENIRAAVVDLLENRIEVMFRVRMEEFEMYCERLASGQYTPTSEGAAAGGIHNHIIEQLREQGCGITDIENAVHDIRGLIQDYFDSFNPHGIGRGKRKRYSDGQEPSV
jgi:hypothetical protein